MGSPCPPHWSFAARAAYFGERLCAFCGHRNPPGASFCNDCAAPLNLKPCRACDAVDDQSASYCHECGSPYPVSAVPEGMATAPAAGATAGRAPTGESPGVPIAPDAGAPVLPAGRRAPRSGQIVVLAAVAVVLIAGAQQAYRAHVPKPATVDAAPPSPAAIEPHASPDPPAEVVVADSTEAETETSAEVQASGPATDVEAPQPATVHRAPPPVSTKHLANVRQRPIPARQQPVGKTAAVAQRPAAARVAANSAKPAKARTPDRWHLMQASLAGCDGDLLARVVCDQQVRRHFCEGHWGVAAECRGGVVNEHGQ